MGKEEALAKGLIEMIDAEVDDAYVAMIKSRLIRPDLIARMADEAKLVYTPLHGTGALPFERVMNELGL